MRVMIEQPSSKHLEWIFHVIRSFVWHSLEWMAPLEPHFGRGGWGMRSSALGRFIFVFFQILFKINSVDWF
jgi:hypothetical protein